MTKTTPPTTKPTLTIERVFKATPERLWTYWTEPAKYAKWLNPAPGHDLVIHEFDVREGGRVRFDMPQPDGNKNPQEGVFHVLKPFTKIVSGDADKTFLLTVTFTRVDQERTRMTVVAEGVPEDWHAPATQGWNQGFDKLEGLLPTPKGKGFRIERILKAPPHKVWTMWTTKAGLEKWFVPEGFTTRVTKLDVRPGGTYDLEMRDGKQTLHNHGTYTDVQPSRRLAWIWRFDIYLGPDEQPYDVAISVELEAVPEGTKMTFTEGPLATAEFTQGSREGVESNFRKLEKALAA